MRLWVQFSLFVKKILSLSTRFSIRLVADGWERRKNQCFHSPLMVWHLWWKRNPTRIFIFTTPAKPWRGEWKYYHSWLMGNLFFSICGFAAHREKSNPYFSSDEDYLNPSCSRWHNWCYSIIIFVWYVISILFKVSWRVVPSFFWQWNQNHFRSMTEWMIDTAFTMATNTLWKLIP